MRYLAIGITVSLCMSANMLALTQADIDAWMRQHPDQIPFTRVEVESAPNCFCDPTIRTDCGCDDPQYTLVAYVGNVVSFRLPVTRWTNDYSVLDVANGGCICCQGSSFHGLHNRRLSEITNTVFEGSGIALCCCTGCSWADMNRNHDTSALRNYNWSCWLGCDCCRGRSDLLRYDDNRVQTDYLFIEVNESDFNGFALQPLMTAAPNPNTILPNAAPMTDPTNRTPGGGSR